MADAMDTVTTARLVLNGGDIVKVAERAAAGLSSAIA